MTAHEDWRFEHQTAYQILIDHFQVHNLDGFGLKGMVAGINAAGAMLNYIKTIFAYPWITCRIYAPIPPHNTCH